MFILLFEDEGKIQQTSFEFQIKKFAITIWQK